MDNFSQNLRLLKTMYFQLIFVYFIRKISYIYIYIDPAPFQEVLVKKFLQMITVEYDENGYFDVFSLIE